MLLDTPEARSAAQTLHSQAVEERDQHESVEDGLADHGVHEGLGEHEEDGLHRSPHDFSPEEEGIVRVDNVDHGSEDQVPLSVVDAAPGSGGGREAGKLHEDDINNDGDDEGELDDEEEGEIVEDESQQPPNEVFLGGDEGDNNVGGWEGEKGGIGSSGRGGTKRNFGERDSEDGGDLSPSFGSGKRRRRV